MYPINPPPHDTLPMPPVADATGPQGPQPPAVTRPIRFVHGGKLHQVSGLPSTLSVLSWLREHQHCTGTKEGCNEGDCGACTVLVGELDASGQRLQLTPLNSCLQFLPTLDGKALLTVESLGGQHPAQQALVACHGSQCGFCTPGFVMSLAASYQRHADAGPGAPPSRQQLADDLSGNLCRCTGYRPILDAGEQMFQGPSRPIATAALVQALQALRGDPPLHYADDTPFHAPRSLDALAALRLSRPQARLLAGNTDIGLWVNKQFRSLGELIYLGEVAALKAITNEGGQLRIGAGASLEVAWAALASHWPRLREMYLRFASRPVREAGTLGGNLANGSPIGDSAPVLMVLGASLMLRRGAVQRQLPLDAFYLGYQRSALAEGEFIEAITVPLPDAADAAQVRAYKLSKRYDCDISAVACGLAVTLDAGGRVARARLAWGGLAASVRRAAATEAAITGQPWTETTLRAGQAALAQDFQPLTDLRASAGYRLRVAQALLERYWLETRADAPLAAAEVSVWSMA
jgi:xanthine dehydrogenase small subunit